MENEVTSFDEFHKLIDGYVVKIKGTDEERIPAIVFRGIKSLKYDLIPSVGRMNFYGDRIADGFCHR